MISKENVHIKVLTIFFWLLKSDICVIGSNFLDQN